MKSHCCVAFVFALLVFLAFVAPSNAVEIVPGAFGAVQTVPFGATTQAVYGQPTQSSSYDGPLGSISVASVSGTIPFAKVSSSGPSTAGEAAESYFFQIQGPANTSNIPGSISGNLFTLGNAYLVSAAIDAFQLVPGAGAIIAGGHYPGNYPGDELGTPGLGMPVESVSGGGASTQLRHFTDAVSFSSNTLYEVELGAAVYTDAAGQIAEAIADPYIKIDPSFLAANPGYSLEFSAGIDNVPMSETPLPPALPMFCAALLALGAFAWGRREQCRDNI